MITDRTAQDVADATTLKSRGAPFTDEEAAKLERGTLTQSTVNRIESKEAEIYAKWVDVLGYPAGGAIETKTWAGTEFYRASDFARIANNAMALRNWFVVFVDTPLTVSTTSYTYENLNNIERILSDLDEWADGGISAIQRCGATTSGARNILPLGRKTA